MGRPARGELPARLRGYTLGLVALCCSVALAGCDPSGSAPSSPRLVLLFAPCSVSARFLAPYDESVAFTPALRAFAERAIVFARHQTETGQSGPAFASIFSGGQADHHRVYRNPFRLPDDVYVLAEAFVDDGYETFYWIGHPAASVRTNFNQGVPLENTYNGHLVADAPAFREILDKLAADPSYRALVMTTPVLSHAPYHMRNWDAFLQSHPEAAHGLDLDEARDLAELYRENHHLLTWNFEAGAEMLSLSGKRLQEFTQAVGVLYASNINLIDRIFGEIVSAIDERGLEDESLVAFTADHGEVMYRENAPFKWSHGLQLAPEALNVPLLIRAPGVGGQNYQAVTRSMDVFPTLAGLAGVPIGAEHGVQGRDLSVALRSGSTAPHLLAPSHTAVLVESVYKQMYQPRWELAWAIARGFFPRIDVNLIWVSIRDGDMVYKHQKITPEEWEHQVFDLARDPGESVNLFDPADSQHSAMVIALADYKARLVEQHRLDDPEGGTQLPADKEAEMLRSLGYIR